MGRDWEEGGGKLVGGRAMGGVSWWTRRGGTVGSRVRWQFFLLEFSKGNDLRYISKGFLLVGKRVRRRYPPTGEATTACPLPAPSHRELPDNLHFSTINLTFVQLFLPAVRPTAPPSRMFHLPRPHPLRILRPRVTF